MTPLEASTLAIRYKNIWRGGPTNDELIRHFTTLDTTALNLTLDNLANITDYPPTIAHIHREYQRHQPHTYGYQHPADTGEPISLDEYRRRHPGDHLDQWRTRHPSAGTR